jgi:DNA ligase (NAD+)
MKTTPIQEILETLEEAQTQYYNDGTSNLSDSEYDNLYSQLEEIDPENDFFSQVEPTSENSHWKKSKHTFPMGSLAKCNTFEDFSKWINSDFPIVLQEKLDGISICLKYSKGKLVSAITRGNGQVGEDILRNIKKVKNLPLKIDYTEKDVYIRGEILLYHSDFRGLNDAEFKNPRNAAAGIAKRLDGNYCNILSIQVYDILNYQDLNFTTEVECTKFLQDQNFATVETIYCNNYDDASKIYNLYVDSKRDSLDWDIDGLVVKRNVIVDEENDWKRPKNKLAWKFPHQYTSSIIKDIEWNVSSSHVTPVAVLEPVNLGGVTISRASLHNVRFIEERGIGIGAKVEISRRNDVIPYVESVLVKPTTTFEIIKNCPVCNGIVTYEKNSMGEVMQFLTCTNLDCPKKMMSSILKWLSAHECKGISTSVIETLMEKGIITSLLDFLKISEGIKDNKILTLDGFGERKLQILKNQINKTKNTSLINLLSGFGFNRFSRTNIEKIIEAFSVSTLDEFISIATNTKKISSVSGFSTESATNIKNEIEKNASKLSEISTYINIEKATQTLKTSNTLENLVFCFTGALNSMSRKEAEILVKSAGGKIGGVNKNLSYLVTNDTTSGTSKNKKAQALSIKIIDEEQFKRLI